MNVPFALLTSATTRWSRTSFTTPRPPQADLVQWLRKDSKRALDLKSQVFQAFLARLSVVAEMSSNQPGDEVRMTADLEPGT